MFPEFPAPDLGSVLLQESVTLHDVKALQLVYRRHCEVTTPFRPAPGRACAWAMGLQRVPRGPPGAGCRAKCASPGPSADPPGAQTSPIVPDYTAVPAHSGQAVDKTSPLDGVPLSISIPSVVSGFQKPPPFLQHVSWLLAWQVLMTRDP